MGRTVTFDRRAVVASARDLFWERGYDATAVPDLERATGLHRSSIYHAFGSKMGLFEEAATSYLDERVRPLLAPLTAPEAPRDALAGYLRAIRAAVASASPHPGCLLISSANAPIGREAAVARIVADYYRELLGALAAGVRAAAPDLPEVRVGDAARIIAALNVSALALARTSPALAAENVDAALAVCESLGG